nr:unnamed protein product [Digitaria exilis]
MGRAVLVNAVLDSQLVYMMSVMLIPQGVLDAMDRRRHAFFWSGDDSVHGSQCLVAWENTCQPKDQGGLGIRNLALQNKCLLMKLLHRLFNPGESAWAQRVRGRIDLITMEGDLSGSHWAQLESLQPLYNAITYCEVQDGRSTNFWSDCWLPNERVKELFPLLHSHATQEQVSVSQILEHGMRSFLERRLTRGATDGSLRSGPIYKSLITVMGSAQSPFAKFIWGSRAPPRVQLFGWLLVQERIQCRKNLLMKHVHPEEDCNHIIFGSTKRTLVSGEATSRDQRDRRS